MSSLSQQRGLLARKVNINIIFLLLKNLDFTFFVSYDVCFLHPENGAGKGCMGKSVLAKIQEIITTDNLGKLAGYDIISVDIMS